MCVKNPDPKIRLRILASLSHNVGIVMVARMKLTPNTRVYVAGHRGLVGSAIWRELERRGHTNLVGRTHAELELLDAAAVGAFYLAEKPEIVFVAAAKVGGILANDSQPAEFLYENLQVQNNVIHGAWKAGVNYVVLNL